MKTKEDTEIDEFLKNTPVIPCFLISKDEGRIEVSIDGFEKKKIPIEKIKENYFKILYQEEEEDFNILIDKNFSADICLYGNGQNFERKAHSNKDNSEEHKVFVGEYKLYSLNIREEDLSFSKYYKDKFQAIANSDSSDKEKAKELENIFSVIGYFIPKKIYIGGMLINHTDKIKRIKTINTINSLKVSFNKNISINSGFDSSNKSKLNEIFNSEKTEIIGGNTACKNFEEWIKSIKISNSNIIECTNIITAKNIMEDTLRKNLEIPLKIIENKYLREKKYLEYLNEIKNTKLTVLEGESDIIKGICKEIDKSSEPIIYLKTFSIYRDPSTIPFRTTEIFSQNFSDMIVGFKITDERKDNLNGKWTLESNPLGKNDIKITFESKFIRAQHFFIYVYLMKYPGNIMLK